MDFDCDFGGYEYESLQDEMAIEVWREHQAEAHRDEWDEDDGNIWEYEGE